MAKSVIKPGFYLGGLLDSKFIIAILITLFVLLMGIGGGFGAAWNLGIILNQITGFLKQFPSWVWIIIIVLGLIKFSGKKK